MTRAILLALVLCVIPVVSLGQSDKPSESRKRIYIEERLKTTTGASVHCDNYGNCFGHNNSHTRNVSLEATQGFVKKCPEVTVTDNREGADYILRINTGNSTLYKQNGDVAYVSPTRFKVSNLVKDVCGFVQSH